MQVAKTIQGLRRNSVAKVGAQPIAGAAVGAEPIQRDCGVEQAQTTRLDCRLGTQINLP